MVVHIKRRICDIASAGSSYFSIFSSFVFLKQLAHTRSNRPWGVVVDAPAPVSPLMIVIVHKWFYFLL